MKLPWKTTPRQTHELKKKLKKKLKNMKNVKKYDRVSPKG